MGRPVLSMLESEYSAEIRTPQEPLYKKMPYDRQGVKNSWKLCTYTRVIERVSSSLLQQKFVVHFPVDAVRYKCCGDCVERRW
jgi:hypothetical protein